MRHNPGYGIMAQLVQRRPVIIDLSGESRLRRHLHIVERGGVKGLRPADAELGTARGNQRLGGIVRLAFGKRHRRDGEPLGQAVALRDIEHREALEERNRANRVARVVALLVPLRLVRFGDEAVGIEHRPPALALAHAAARRKGLPEGQPVLRGKAALDHRAPQDQDIDP